MPTKSTISKEERIATIHEALDSYEVMIWNGATEPKKVPIGKGITTISEDLRAVKTGQKEHAELLDGIKQRRKAFSMIVALFEYGKATKAWKVVTFLGLLASAVYGFISMADSIFGWNLLK